MTYHSRLVMSPSGVFSIVALIIVGALLGRGTDARWLIAGGLLVAGAGNYWMSQTNLQISPWELVWPRVVLIIGLSMLFAPISVAAFKYIPMHFRGSGGFVQSLAE